MTFNSNSETKKQYNNALLFFFFGISDLYSISQLSIEFSPLLFDALVIIINRSHHNTSLKNNVVISKITINKGNCKFVDRDINRKTFVVEKFLPKKLNEYQQADFAGGIGCKVKIVDMTINNIEWSFLF